MGIAFSMGGVVLSVTAMVLAWRRSRRWAWPVFEGWTSTTHEHGQPLPAARSATHQFRVADGHRSNHD